MKKVGILGGSFDPIHLGHLNLAISLMEAKELDVVLFVPAQISPFKQIEPPHISAEHRLNLLKLAIAPIRQFDLLDWELKREGPSYTIDTVRKLAEDSTMQLHLLLGEDSVPDFHNWKNAEELLELAPPIVGSRHTAACSEILQNAHVKIPLFDISSTQLRFRLRQKKYCGHLLPAEVLEYILKHALYQ